MDTQILLIDDSAMLRRIAAGVLHAQPARYEVIAATRASEGFARACGGEVAVILVDERLAGAGDAEFCRRLLNEPRTAETPVVLLTGQRTDPPKLGSLPGNVVEILCKPFVPAQLASLINAITALAKKGHSLAEMRQALHATSGDREAALAPDHSLPRVDPANIDAARASFPFQTRVVPGETSIRAALRAVVADGLTGVLRFCPADAPPTEVFVENGQIMVVSTRDGTTYSQDAAAVLPAKVSPATLQEAAVEQSDTGVPFLLTIGARGLVSKAAAVDLLRRFGQRHFARLWTIPGRCLRIDFERLEALPGFTLRLESTRETADEWLLATLRLLTLEDLRTEARHQGLVGTPRFQRLGELNLKALPLGTAERHFIQQVDGRRDLPAIARCLGLSVEEAFVMLFRFRCLEILEYRPAPLPFVVTPRTNLRRVLPLKR